MPYLEQTVTQYRPLFVALVIGLFFSISFAQDNAPNQAVTSDLALKPIIGFLPEWSPDGKKIAFSRGGADAQIYTMNVDGTQQTQITKNAGDNRWLSWSGDSSKIAFSSDQDHPMSANGPSRYEVYVINADGTEEQRLTSTDVQSLGPTWSPDSISILYVSGPNGAPGLYRINRDGSGQTKLSVGMNKFVEPDWSPNGSKIAAAKQGFTDHNIYILNANGSGAVKLVTTPGNPRYLDWSPDGSLITFSANGSLKHIDCGSDWRKPNQIFVVKVRNGEIKQLTNDCDESMGPSWSPDGSKIIFSAGSYMKTSIYIMDADGRNKVQMTDVPVF